MGLTDWLLKNAPALALRAEKYSWIGEWLPGFSDYGVILKYAGKEYSGRGIDKREELAFEKAASEALERAAVACSSLEMPWSTAAYPDYEGAKLRAYRELLGIDRVFCHHYTGTKMRKMDWEETGGYFPEGPLRKLLAKYGVDFSLYELRPAADARVVCATASGGGFRFEGFLSGFGVDATVGGAASHAAVECLRTVAACLLTDYAPKEPLEVLKRKGEPRWHFWMAQRVEGLEYLRRRLIPAEGESVVLEPEALSAADVSFGRIDRLRAEFPDLPLEVAQARSEKMVTPQFGEILLSQELRARFANFGGDVSRLGEIPPHFYG